MKDIRLYIEKLHADAEDCLTISQTAPSDVKQRVFTALAETYRELAGELEHKERIKLSRELGCDPIFQL
jgi:hypothetical protein